MEISHELILGPADIDTLSIKCKSCRTVVEVSFECSSLKW